MVNFIRQGKETVIISIAIQQLLKNTECQKKKNTECPALALCHKFSHTF